MTKNAGNVLCTEVLPRLQSAIPQAVSFIGAEDAQELIADGVAMAAKMIHNAEKSGKKVTRTATGRRGDISAGNIAYYTIVKLRNGCRSSVRKFTNLARDQAKNPMENRFYAQAAGATRPAPCMVLMSEGFFMKNKFAPLLVLLALLAAMNLAAQRTAFTYQGLLQNNGSPASGTFNFTFSHYATSANGNAVTGPITNSGVNVSNGLFTATVDFGTNAFSGSNAWSQTECLPNSDCHIYAMKTVRMPKHFAQQASGQSSNAFRRAYSKKAKVIVSSLEDYEAKIVPMQAAVNQFLILAIGSPARWPYLSLIDRRQR